MQDIIFQHICGHMGQGGSRTRARFCANLCHVAFAKMSALENVSVRSRCTLQCWTFSKMVHITNKQMLQYVYKKIQVQKYKVHKYKKYEHAKCKTTALENGFAQGKSTMDIASQPSPPPKHTEMRKYKLPFLSGEKMHFGHSPGLSPPSNVNANEWWRHTYGVLMYSANGRRGHPIPHICHFFYLGRIFENLILHQKKRLKAPKTLKMSRKKSNICIFFTQSGKIYT